MSFNSEISKNSRRPGNQALTGVYCDAIGGDKDGGRGKGDAQDHYGIDFLTPKA